MREEAVSPVVAFMLLLMVVVSFISLLNAYYIPSLKQQAEIEHLNNIEQVFNSLGSDIDRMITFHSSGEIHEKVPLGGGDVLFSPVKSSGSLIIHSPDQIPLTLTVNGISSKKEVPIGFANISYRPIGNFWVNQGYTWDSGLIKVTKGHKFSWINEDVIERKTDFIVRGVWLDDIKHEKEQLTNLTIYTSQAQNVSSKSFISGNGYGSINISSNVNSPYEMIECTEIRFTVNDKSPGYEVLWDKTRKILEQKITGTNLKINNETNKWINISFVKPYPDISIQQQHISISVS